MKLALSRRQQSCTKGRIASSLRNEPGGFLLPLDIQCANETFDSYIILSAPIRVACFDAANDRDSVFRRFGVYPDAAVQTNGSLELKSRTKEWEEEMRRIEEPADIFCWLER